MLLDQHFAETVQRDRRDVVALARAETPVRSGVLRSSWELASAPEGGTLRNSVRYAGFQLRGQLAARVRAAVADHLPSIQPELVRRIVRER